MSGWMLPTVPFLFVLAFMISLTAPAQAADFPPADALPDSEELPDLLTFRDGPKVASPQDWSSRRTELLAMIQHYEYGDLPPAGETRAALIQSHSMRPNSVLHRQYKVTAGAPGKEVSFVLDLMFPPSPTTAPSSTASRPTPSPSTKHPVILRGDWCWGKTSEAITKLVLDRGYALAEFNRCELAPDNDRRDSGLYLAYPDGEFGSLAAWAWGYARCVDVLLTLPEIDGKRIAITGHSRGGKATLLAGALDERIALVNANASGCGGGAPFREPDPRAETMAAILDHFPYWFTPRLRDFVGHETRLPFDQHAVRAAIAPRFLLDTEGLQDLWANPTGARQMHDAALPVFALLGVADHAAIHYRPGKHEHNDQDWTALLDFADKVFKQKPTTRNFDMRPQ